MISIQEQVSHIEKRIEQTKQNGDRLKHEHDQQVNLWDYGHWRIYLVWEQAQEVTNLEQSLGKLNKSSEEYEGKYWIYACPLIVD